MQKCGVWMAAWLKHAACQLQADEQVFFSVYTNMKWLYELC
ncbi:putative signal peptide protein [Puccinia sorghi]|uniref:Putative signal peptide protein n=1 Tax=Puccinia sorghi TaxID=27349 RepID=A0A0L6U6C1_9BASI|nr:putative signal peptide protein [Puccinia sorghi]